KLCRTRNGSNHNMCFVRTMIVATASTTKETFLLRHCCVFRPLILPFLPSLASLAPSAAVGLLCATSLRFRASCSRPSWLFGLHIFFVLVRVLFEFCLQAAG